MYLMPQIRNLRFKPGPKMLKVLRIIHSSTSQKIILPVILILFSYHYLLFPYISYALMFQVHIDI